MNNLKPSLKIAKKLGIKVIFSDDLKVDSPDYEVRGRWIVGKEILINKKIATNYTVLHEIGHVLCGYACCREHCEYMAHGAAITLAKLNKIRLHSTAIYECDLYSGRSNHKVACAGYEKMKEKRERCKE